MREGREMKKPVAIGEDAHLEHCCGTGAPCAACEVERLHARLLTVELERDGWRADWRTTNTALCESRDTIQDLLGRLRQRDRALRLAERERGRVPACPSCGLRAWECERCALPVSEAWRRRDAAIDALRACLRKWTGCADQMVGRLYPDIVEARYLRPLRRKIAELCRPGALAHWRD